MPVLKTKEPLEVQILRHLYVSRQGRNIDDLVTMTITSKGLVQKSLDELLKSRQISATSSTNGKPDYHITNSGTKRVTAEWPA